MKLLKQTMWTDGEGKRTCRIILELDENDLQVDKFGKVIKMISLGRDLLSFIEGKK